MIQRSVESIERAKLGVLKAVERALKISPADAELVRLRAAAGEDWLAWNNRLKAMQLAKAAKADRGVELFVIFHPRAGGLREYVRTKLRSVGRWVRAPWYLSKPESIEQLQDADGVVGPLWDFAYQMEDARKCCDRERAAFQTAHKNFPAWALKGEAA